MTEQQGAIKIVTRVEKKDNKRSLFLVLENHNMLTFDTIREIPVTKNTIEATET